MAKASPVFTPVEKSVHCGRVKAFAVSREGSADDLAGLLTEITLLNTACVAGRGRSLQD